MTLRARGGGPYADPLKGHNQHYQFGALALSGYPPSSLSRIVWEVVQRPEEPRKPPEGAAETQG